MKTVLFTLSALVMTVLTSFAPGNQATMIADWERAKAYTKEYLDAMPEDGLGFKPTPEIRSFAEQMAHLANANFMFASMASGKTSPYQGKNLEKLDEYTKSKANLTNVVMESYDYVIAALKGMTDAQLAETVKMRDNMIPKGILIDKAFEHQTHHRGQTTIYLRLKGVVPPGEKLF